METPDIKIVLKKLNSRFFTSLVRFRKGDKNILPTIQIVIKPNKFVSQDFFTLTDKFYVVLEEELAKMGIVDISFNNSRHSFWWHPSTEKNKK